MEMSKEYASKGVAGAGLGTGIAGLSLGVINSLGGLAGLGGNRTTQNDVLTAMLTADMLRGRSAACGSDCDPVTQREIRLVQEIAAKDSQIALRDANTYNDQKNIEMYKYIDGRFQEFERELARQAVVNQKTEDSFQLVAKDIQCCCDRLAVQIERERDERKCADNTIITYTNATFYPIQKADLTTGTTSTAVQTFNPLSCNKDCDCGH